MTSPIHLDTAARALDALPPDEADAFDAHLAGCETCAAEYTEFLATTAMLAASAAEPPPERLRERVLRAASITPQLPPLTGGPAAQPGPEAPPGLADDIPVGSPAGRHRLATPRWRRAALLVAAAVAAALIAGGVIWATRPAGPSPDQAAVRCVAAASDAHVQHPSVGSGGSVTVARSCGAAIVRLAAMPAPPTGRAYQLWVMAGSNARSAGMVAQERTAAGQIIVTGITHSDTDIGVSVEPAGGSKSPTTTPVWVVPLRG